MGENKSNVLTANILPIHSALTSYAGREHMLYVQYKRCYVAKIYDVMPACFFLAYKQGYLRDYLWNASAFDGQAFFFFFLPFSVGGLHFDETVETLPWYVFFFFLRSIYIHFQAHCCYVISNVFLKKKHVVGKKHAFFPETRWGDRIEAKEFKYYYVHYWFTVHAKHQTFNFDV